MKKPKYDGAPQMIFLQWHGDAESDEFDGSTNLDESGAVSWCRDKIFKHDIEYVRLDIHRQKIEAAKKAKKKGERDAE